MALHAYANAERWLNCILINHCAQEPLFHREGLSYTYSCTEEDQQQRERSENSLHGAEASKSLCLW
jgi:hypothetical protein